MLIICVLPKYIFYGQTEKTCSWQDLIEKTPENRFKIREQEVKKSTFIKLKLNLSHDDWSELCALFHLTKRKEAMLKCIYDHACWANVSPFTNGLNGAYSSCENVFNFLLDQITHKEMWALNDLHPVVVKVFADGRALWGKNWFSGISVCSVTNPQDYHCFQVISMMKIEQTMNKALMNTIEQQVHLLKYMEFLHMKPIKLHLQDGKVVSHTVATCICVDWAQALAYTKCAQPNASAHMMNIQDQRICIKHGCTFTVADKLGKWLENPWKKYYGADSLKVELNKPIKKRLVYDPLHSYTNVLLNMLSSCRTWLKQINCNRVATKLTHCMSVFVPGWPHTTFMANTAKKIVSSNGLSDLLQDSHEMENITLTVQWRSYKQKTLSVHQILCCMVDVFLFCYTWLHCASLTADMKHQWEKARNNLIALCVCFGGQNLNPSIHYWCEHSWSDALIYCPPHYLKQELGEAMNKWHKRFKTTCCKGRISTHDMKNSWECLLMQLYALLSLSKDLNIALTKI